MILAEVIYMHACKYILGKYMNLTSEKHLEGLHNIKSSINMKRRKLKYSISLFTMHISFVVSQTE